MKKFTKENLTIEKIPNKAGIYYFYDSKRKLIYVGHSDILRHRIQSYFETDDFHTHPTKKPLRTKIEYFDFKVMNLEKAKDLEKTIKANCKYNFK